MTLDVKMRATSKKLIEKFGKLVDIRRVTSISYDGSTGVGGEENAPVDHPVYITPPVQYKVKNNDGTVITTNELVVSIAALDAPIIPNKDTDSFVIDGSDRKIVEIEEVWSGALVTMYTMRLAA